MIERIAGSGMSPPEPDRCGQTICDRFELQKKIGSGAFGQLFLAQDKQTNKQVAVKLEKLRAKVAQLANEYKVYLRLKDAPGFPHCYAFERTDTDRVLVIDWLSKSLKELFEQCHNKLTMKTVVYIAIQIITRLETFHDLGLVYRDVKPENFMIGSQPNHKTVYMIDFGLTKEYIHPITRQHIAFSDNKTMTGTIRYMSVAGHYKHELSRKDDIESVCYMLLFFLRGSLPWLGMLTKKPKSEMDQQNKVIGSMKENTLPEALFAGYPNQMANILRDVRKLKFEERPDYDAYRQHLKQAFGKLNCDDDQVFDWESL